jgi:hypothetical protein
MERQFNRKSTAPAFLAVCPDGTAVAQNNFTGQIEANPQATYRTIKIVRSVKTFKYMREIAGRDANACIAHPEARALRPGLIIL